MAAYDKGDVIRGGLAIRFGGLCAMRTMGTVSGGGAIVNLALDTGATWTLVSREIADLVGYDPASIQQRTAMTTGAVSSIARN
jgi:predicted aspartyl protease